MKFSPQNRLYIILIALGLFLVTITIVLQATLLISGAEPASANEGFVATLRRQIANAIEPSQGSTTVSPNLAADVPQVPTATSTPFIIVVAATPASIAPTSIVATSVAATFTATALPVAPVLTNTPTTIPVIAATATISVATPSALVEPTNAAPVDAPAAPPDQPAAFQGEIRLAYTSRRVDCTAITNIVQELLNTRLQMQAQVRFFDSPTQLFDALSKGDADITLCYLDPDDRPFMSERLGMIRQIGETHRVGEDYKLQIWSNGSYRAVLRDHRACVLDFLEKMDFTDLDMTSQDASAWIQSHTDDISRWFNCSL